MTERDCCPPAVGSAPIMGRARAEKIFRLWSESKGEPWEAMQAIREYQEMKREEEERGHGGTGDVRDVLEGR